MPASAAVPPPTPADLHALFPADELLLSLFETSMSGVILFKPIWAAGGGEVVDLAFALLNPAAQQLLALPACPAQTHQQLFGTQAPASIFAFYCEVLRTGQPGRLDFSYQHDGLDSHFRVAAQCVGQGLLASFTDTAAQPRPAVEQALQASRAREQAALAQAEHQRNQLQALINQAPVAIGYFEGPAQRITAANAQMAAIWGRPSAEVLGHSLVDALPELRGQGFDELIAQVFNTKVPVVGTEAPATMWRNGQLLTTYYNFVYQPIYDEHDAVLGVIDVAVEVTEQVRARQLTEEKERQTNLLNEELAAANEEIRANNDELFRTQHALRQLNEQLEGRVAVRTQAWQAAQAEAEAQRQRLLNLVSQAPALIANLVGPQHIIELANNNFRQAFGNRPLLGKPHRQAVPELEGQQFFELLDKVYRTGETYYGQEQLAQLNLTNSGQLEGRYFDFIYQAARDLVGQIEGVLIFAHDVTERVRARQHAEALQADALAAAQRLAAQREMYYQVFEQTPALVCLLRGRALRYEYANPSFRQSFSGGEVEGRTVAEVRPEAVEQGIVALLEQVYQTGKPFTGTEMPLELYQADGTLRLTYFDLTYQPFRENGLMTGIAIFGFDVTERVLARQQLSDSQAQLHLALEAGNLVTFNFDLLNQQFERSPNHDALYGYPAPAMGWNLEKLWAHIMPEDRVRVAQQWQASLASGSLWLTPRILRLDGEVRHIETLGKVFHNVAGEPVRLTGVSADVTARTQAQWQLQDLSEELAMANQELAAANEELLASSEETHTANSELARANHQLVRTNADLDNFIYTASHDLRAPISNIEGLLYALREELPAARTASAEVQPILSMMQDAVERFKRTINHLTDISKLQQEYTRPPAVVNLAFVIEAVCLDLRPQIASAGAQLTVDVAACPTLAFSEKNLRSLLYNLLSNALKYSDPARAPRVAISCQPAEGYGVLTVQDNGLGLDAAQQRKLFGMFQRLHTHVEGSGIGLYMVKKIVENAGGTIGVESQLGVGTTFTVTIPR